MLKDEGSGQVANPVDIGLKVANEIIGLHSQAQAAGRALAHSTRHVELMQEENTQLKVGVKFMLCCYVWCSAVRCSAVRCGAVVGVLCCGVFHAALCCAAVSVLCFS